MDSIIMFVFNYLSRRQFNTFLFENGVVDNNSNRKFDRHLDDKV